MVTDETGETRPWFLPFSEDARALMDAFRESVRAWEAGSEGLLLSFIGKLPGLATRLSLVLAFLDWAADGAEEPQDVTSTPNLPEGLGSPAFPSQAEHGRAQALSGAGAAIRPSRTGGRA